MADPVFVDGVTPLNAVNMTKLQTRDEKGAPSGYAPLDAGSKVPAANLNLAAYQPVAQKDQPSGYVGLDVNGAVALGGPNPFGNTLLSVRNAAAGGILGGFVTGDAQFRFLAHSDGKIEWGSGGAGFDTNLYRAAASRLQTDGELVVNGAGATGKQVYIATDGGLYFGQPFDVCIYRQTTATLATVGNFTFGGVVQAPGPIWNTDDSASIWKGLLFGTAQDAKLYRSAANALKTDGVFTAGGVVYANQAAAATAQVWIGQYGGSVPYAGITLGGDTYLYRGGAGILATDSVLRIFRGSSTNEAFSTQIGGSLYFTLRQDGQLSWSGDTHLYRSAAGQLDTDGYFRVTKDVGAGGYSALWLYFSGTGFRQVAMGAPNSGPPGYTVLCVLN